MHFFSYIFGFCIIGIDESKIQELRAWKRKKIFTLEKVLSYDDASYVK